MVQTVFPFLHSPLNAPDFLDHFRFTARTGVAVNSLVRPGGSGWYVSIGAGSVVIDGSLIKDDLDKIDAINLAHAPGTDRHYVVYEIYSYASSDPPASAQYAVASAAPGIQPVLPVGAVKLADIFIPTTAASIGSTVDPPTDLVKVTATAVRIVNAPRLWPKDDTGDLLENLVIAASNSQLIPVGAMTYNNGTGNITVTAGGIIVQSLSSSNRNAFNNAPVVRATLAAGTYPVPGVSPTRDVLVYVLIDRSTPGTAAVVTLKFLNRLAPAAAELKELLDPANRTRIVILGTVYGVRFVAAQVLGALPAPDSDTRKYLNNDPAGAHTWQLINDADLVGGMVSVATSVARLAIPADQRKEGMTVYQRDTDRVYVLAADLTTWSSSWPVDTVDGTLTDLDLNAAGGFRFDDANTPGYQHLTSPTANDLALMQPLAPTPSLFDVIAGSQRAHQRGLGCVGANACAVTFAANSVTIGTGKFYDFQGREVIVSAPVVIDTTTLGNGVHAVVWDGLLNSGAGGFDVGGVFDRSFNGNVNWRRSLVFGVMQKTGDSNTAVTECQLYANGTTCQTELTLGADAGLVLEANFGRQGNFSTLRKAMVFRCAYSSGNNEDHYTAPRRFAAYDQIDEGANLIDLTSWEFTDGTNNLADDHLDGMHVYGNSVTGTTVNNGILRWGVDGVVSAVPFINFRNLINSVRFSDLRFEYNGNTGVNNDNCWIKNPAANLTVDNCGFAPTSSVGQALTCLVNYDVSTTLGGDGNASLTPGTRFENCTFSNICTGAGRELISLATANIGGTLTFDGCSIGGNTYDVARVVYVASAGATVDVRFTGGRIESFDSKIIESNATVGVYTVDGALIGAGGASAAVGPTVGRLTMSGCVFNASINLLGASLVENCSSTAGTVTMDQNCQTVNCDFPNRANANKNLADLNEHGARHVFGQSFYAFTSPKKSKLLDGMVVRPGVSFGIDAQGDNGGLAVIEDGAISMPNGSVAVIASQTSMLLCGVAGGVWENRSDINNVVPVADGDTPWYFYVRFKTSDSAPVLKHTVVPPDTYGRPQATAEAGFTVDDYAYVGMLIPFDTFRTYGSNDSLGQAICMRDFWRGCHVVQSGPYRRVYWSSNQNPNANKPGYQTFNIDTNGAGDGSNTTFPSGTGPAISRSGIVLPASMVTTPNGMFCRAQKVGVGVSFTLTIGAGTGAGSLNYFTYAPGVFDRDLVGYYGGDTFKKNYLVEAPVLAAVSPADVRIIIERGDQTGNVGAAAGTTNFSDEARGVVWVEEDVNNLRLTKESEGQWGP